jgi:hypothetical protein
MKAQEGNEIVKDNNTLHGGKDTHPITCFICLEIYSSKKKPLILVCGHTFCDICLQNLFDNCNEIQCCFCKVITKLDRFEDMIINYAILSLVENFNKANISNINNIYINNQNNLSQQYGSNSANPVNVNTILNQSLQNHSPLNNSHSSIQEMKYCSNHKNPETVEKLLQCVDCNMIACSLCLELHRNHKLTNLSSYIETEANLLSDFLKNYRDLINKMAVLNKKIDKSELEKYIKNEKENVNIFFKDMKSLLDKNHEMINHSLDKLLKESYKSVDTFKKEMKSINFDSQRYTSIVEELCNFKNISNKQKAKILSIYNLNSTFYEIKEFNKEVNTKIGQLISPEIFLKRFTMVIKNCVQHKNKMKKFHQLIGKKVTDNIERYENGVTGLRFYIRNFNKVTTTHH